MNCWHASIYILIHFDWYGILWRKSSRCVVESEVYKCSWWITWFRAVRWNRFIWSSCDVSFSHAMALLKCCGSSAGSPRAKSSWAAEESLRGCIFPRFWKGSYTAWRMKVAFGKYLAACYPTVNLLSLTKKVSCLGNAVTFYCLALFVFFHKWA